MAPVFKTIFNLLLIFPVTSKTLADSVPTQDQSCSRQVDDHHQQPVGIDFANPCKAHTNADEAAALISTVSWGTNRIDVFGLAGKTLVHNYWNGDRWWPPDTGLEYLGEGLNTPPVVATWGPDRLDVFGLDEDQVIKHQYWDGEFWQPRHTRFEDLGRECASKIRSPSISAVSWGPGRLDIFCQGYNGHLLHQFYDGSQWHPAADSMEDLGGRIRGEPTAISRGKDRLDVLGINYAGQPVHLYWDGSQWSQWQTIPIKAELDEVIGLTLTSWAENRLDAYAAVSPNTFHNYWNGSQWASWEILSSTFGVDGLAATSSSVNRMEIAVKGPGGITGQNILLFKFFDGEAWKPGTKPDPYWPDWYSHYPDVQHDPGSALLSDPSMVSWGADRLDIFYLNQRLELVHQAWIDDQWFPGQSKNFCCSIAFESLGSGFGPY